MVEVILLVCGSLNFLPCNEKSIYTVTKVVCSAFRTSYLTTVHNCNQLITPLFVTVVNKLYVNATESYS